MYIHATLIIALAGSTQSQEYVLKRCRESLDPDPETHKLELHVYIHASLIIALAGSTQEYVLKRRQCRGRTIDS